ncbi:unnamed protein product [Mytilus coruscus]|uniref:Ig-like domain-containing protein n=1 Tax=Mytilus coruscus TaxID=42192 RepID=A0A6J8DVL5_MYTCO|nr:unnamed protein product [Mytilus coruscus]
MSIGHLGRGKRIELFYKKNEQLNTAKFRFSVAYTTHLKQVIYLRIYNITLEEESIFECYYTFQNNKPTIYTYTIQLAHVTNSLINDDNGTVCCVVHGQHIKAANFIWEQRTLFNERNRFIKSVNINCSGMSKRGEISTTPKSSDIISCLNININGILLYNTEGKYICTAEIFIDRRNEAISRTSSFNIDNIQDSPICIQHTRNQHSIPGAYTSIGINFYSNPKYLTVFSTKDDNELELENISTISIKNISLDIYNVTVKVSGYQIKINIPEFSEEDIGNHTVDITYKFGSSYCTVQLLAQVDIKINRYPPGNVIEGQSVIFIRQSVNRRKLNIYSWTKNGVILSNSSSIVVENVTQNDTGNYTCHMKNEQRYITKNELLIVSPSRCMVDLNESHGKFHHSIYRSMQLLLVI